MKTRRELFYTLTLLSLTLCLAPAAYAKWFGGGSPVNPNPAFGPPMSVNVNAKPDSAPQTVEPPPPPRPGECTIWGVIVGDHSEYNTKVDLYGPDGIWKRDAKVTNGQYKFTNAGRGKLTLWPLGDYPSKGRRQPRLKPHPTTQHVKCGPNQTHRADFEIK